MAKHSISGAEKCGLIFESIFIFSYLVCGIIALCLTLQMYSEHLQSTRYYYYYLIHSRVRIPSYNALLDFKNVDDECPLYPDPAYKPSYILQFKPRKVLELGLITGANVTDVSETVQLYDLSLEGTKVMMNTSYLYDLSYYNFDLQEPGESTVTLQTKYQFSVWRGTKMCVLTLKLNDPQAMALIPADKNCTIFLENDKSVECGLYLDTYKLCMQLNFLSMNETVDAIDFNSSSWDPSWICPYNYFKIDFNPNPSYNSSDPTSQKIKGLTYQQFANHVEDPEYANYTDKYLFYDLDNAILAKYQQIEKPDETFVFAESDPAEYHVGNAYGFIDSFAGIIDSYDFMDMYNQTFYKEPVVNNKTGNITYDPNFLRGSGNSYFRPTDLSKNKTQIKLTYWGHPVLSKDCFDNFITQNNYFYYWENLNKIGTDFLDESLPLLIAWVIVQLFISIFWHFKIRFSLIRYKLDKGQLSPPDERSEFETKFTTKLVNVIMFALLFNGTIYQDKTFTNIIEFTQGIITYRCYPDQTTLDSFSVFQSYVTSLREKNGMILKTLMISAFTESIVMVMFTFQFLMMLKKKRELQMLEDTLKKVD
jgi:hypothetical protein